jgi:glycosyltransferase involved in cell wall biosynthesis
VSAKPPLDILVVSINYSPEPTGFAPHVTAFCEHMAAVGHRVTVFTGFPFAPNWARWPEYGGKFIKLEYRSGVRVVRQTHFIPRSARRMMQRILMEGTFCLTGILSLVRFRPRADVVIYVGAQPSLAMFARLVAGLKGVPYGVMINDLAAGAASDVGIVKSSFLQWCLHTFENASYRGAAGAMVLGQGFKDALVADGYPASRVQVVRSPVDVESVQPRDVDMAFRQHHGFGPQDFVVLFAGSMGLKQGLDNVIAAASRLKDECPEVKWLLVGEGETRAEIERLIVCHTLADRVRLIPFQPVEQLSAMFSAGDVLLLNQLAAVKNTVVPSKLLTYMSAGRPVLAAVNSASRSGRPGYGGQGNAHGCPRTAENGPGEPGVRAGALRSAQNFAKTGRLCPWPDHARRHRQPMKMLPPCLLASSAQEEPARLVAGCQRLAAPVNL